MKLLASILALAMSSALVRAFELAPPAPIADEQVRVVLNQTYRETASGHCTLDLAVLKQPASAALPAIVVIHGGGWIEGDKSSFVSTEHRNPANILDFAKRGYVAISINYRMSKEAPWPAALDDCRAAVRWLRAHAAEYRVDGGKVAAYGNSAGGHLALLLGLMPEPEKLAEGEPNPTQLNRVQAVVSDSGPLDLALEHQRNTLRGVIEKFMGGPPDAAHVGDYRRASPVSYVSDRVPPLLLIYGETDTQVHADVADQFVAALSRAGAKQLDYYRLAGVDHCPHSLIKVGFLRPVVDDFFDRALKPPALGR